MSSLFSSSCRRLCLLLSASLAFAAADGNAAVGEQHKRIALVIGNAKYKDSPLLNPGNDAQDMAAVLRSVGFEVIERTDATQKEMNRAITQFGESLNADSVALFYYAGHGVQVKGKNYLIPVDAQITGESSIRAEAVDVDTVLDQLSASELNVVILDACRNNPFERRFRSISGGLAQMDAPKGSLIAYSTAPGKTAIDGAGRNGIYTQELLRQIAVPGLPLETVLKNVRRSVARATNDQQIPWESSSLTGDFYFNSGVIPAFPPTGAKNADMTQPSLAAERPATDTATRQKIAVPLTAEDELWKAAAEINTLATYETYLSEFPNGRYGSAARLRIASMRPTEPAKPKPAAGQPPQAVAARSELGSPPQETRPPVAASDEVDRQKKLQTARVAPVQAAIARPATNVAAPVIEAPPRTDGPPVEPVARPKPEAVEKSVKLRDMSFVGDFTVSPETGLPSGKGRVLWPNGDQFEGEINNGKPNGQGAYTLKSGAIYSGTWANGKQEGKGRVTYAKGGYWEGEFKDDQQVLTGPMNIKLDNVSISGVFTLEPNSSALTGKGQFSWSSGDYYDGEEVQGVKQGKGRFVWANGHRYEGDWERDRPSGKGIIVFANGDRYEGEVRDGSPNGQGVFTAKSGDVYRGAWVDGRKQGLGRYTWAAGNYWEGEFKDDKQTDKGQLFAGASAAAVEVKSGAGATNDPAPDGARQ